MAGIIELIQDLLDNILTRDPKEIQKKRELRKIYDFLKSIKPQYYKASHSLVLPGFANILLEFVKTIRPLCDLLSKTINNSNEKLANLYKRHLIESRLSEAEQDRIRTLTYEAVKERILQTEHPEEELKIIGNEIQEIIKRLSEPQFNNFDMQYNQLEKLTSLCKINYQKLLNLFDSKFQLNDLKRKPNFTPVTGELIINDLLDIYYILWGFNPAMALQDNLTILYKRLVKADKDETTIKIKKIVNRLDQLLKKHFAQSTILFLIRAIKEDPFFNPEVDREFQQYLNTYKEQLSSQYSQIRDRIMRERRENAIQQDIESLFGQADLLEIEGYNTSIAEMLHKENLESFKYIKPMQITKSFSVAKFEKSINENINKLLVEGFFDNKLFQNSLSDSYHACANVLPSINKFEEEINGNGKYSINGIRKYLSSENTKEKAKPIIKRIIDGIDAKALSIIEESTNAYYKLASSVAEILNDFKQNAPVYISNIKVIGGVKNREFITSLINDYNDMVKFIRIMKNFTIIKTK